MRISDWSSDVCSSDLQCGFAHAVQRRIRKRPSRAAAANLAVSGVAGGAGSIIRAPGSASPSRGGSPGNRRCREPAPDRTTAPEPPDALRRGAGGRPRSRSEEHTSELQSLMRISYAVFCLKKKKEKQLTTASI